MGRSGNNSTRGARPVFRVDRPPMSDGALEVLVFHLDQFVAGHHAAEHGRSGYALDQCPFGCQKLHGARAAITDALERIRRREQDLRDQLRGRGLELPLPVEVNREAWSRDAAEAVKVFAAADQELFLHGHGRSLVMQGALAALEDEYRRAADVNVRAITVIAAG